MLNECGKNNIQVWDLEIGIVSYLNIRYQNRSETMKLHAFGGRGGDVGGLGCKVEKRFHGHLCVLCVFVS